MSTSDTPHTQNSVMDEYAIPGWPAGSEACREIAELRNEINDLRTALDEEIRKARKQALEDAADWFFYKWNGAGHPSKLLRAIANSLTPTSQQAEREKK